MTAKKLYTKKTQNDKNFRFGTVALRRKEIKKAAPLMFYDY